VITPPVALDAKIKPIRDKATAAALYARQAGEAIDFQNVIIDVAIRAERRAGELLAEMEKNKGGPERIVRSPGVTALPKLSEIGISKKQSSQWQKMAEVPSSSRIL